MSFSIPTWLKQDDDLMLGDRPGSSDWFALSDEVGRGRINHRRDVIKIESLLNQAGLFDLEKLDGPWGYANERLDAPIKEYQKRNGLKVDGYLRPDGETINRFREDYGDKFANFPAPTPAMADAHHALREKGEDGLLVDRWPELKINPHPRLDPLAAKAGFDEWNESWAKHAVSANGSFDGIPAELKKYVDQDPVRGIMQARDMTQRWDALRPGEGNKFARAMLHVLGDKPEYQSAYLASEIPQGPPIGTPRADAAQRYAALVEEGRAVAGDEPPMVIPGTPEDRREEPPKTPEQPEHIFLDIDGEENSRRGPTRKEILDAQREEDNEKSECVRLRDEIMGISNQSSEARYQYGRLGREISALRETIRSEETSDPQEIPTNRPSQIDPGSRSDSPERRTRPGDQRSPTPTAPKSKGKVGAVIDFGIEIGKLGYQELEKFSKGNRIDALKARLNDMEKEQAAFSEAMAAADRRIEALRAKHAELGCDRFNRAAGRDRDTPRVPSRAN